MLMAAAPEPYADAAEHLLDELAWVERLLARHVAGLKAAGRFEDDPFRGLFVSEREVAALLETPPAEPHGPREAHPGGAEALRARIDARLAATRAPLPLPGIATRCGLDPFAAACLLLAAAPSIDRRYETLFAYAQNDVGRRFAAVDLALALLAPEPAARLARLAAFRSDAPVLRHRLVRLGEPERPLTARAMLVDERVLFALLDAPPAPDARLAPFLRRFDAPRAPPEAEADPLVAACLRHLEGPRGSLLLLRAPPDSGQRQLAARACAACGRALIAADLAHPAAAGLAADEIGALLRREALIEPAGIMLVADEALPEQRLEQVAAAAAWPGLPLFAATTAGSVARARLGGVRLAEIELPGRSVRERARWWREALAARALPHDPAAPLRLGVALRLGPERIAEVLDAAGAAGEIMAVARSRVASDLPALARRVRPVWDWSDLVLPARQLGQLRRLAAVLEHAPTVIGAWGFAGGGARVQNTVGLFSGPSGTGKTMAASLVAASVGLDLYACNVAAVFDKYVGETEKNLDRLFLEAERANAVLLIDEADVLFAQRTELRDGHDRYGNLAVGYLLQRIEAYDGLVILATNLAGNMDDAFARRLSHVVLFPMPDAALRRRLWQQAFPPAAPLAPDLDLEALARGFELTGGNIRNAALAAAYLAAAAGQPIGRGHVLAAIASELEKMGRRPIAADFGTLAAEAGVERA